MNLGTNSGNYLGKIIGPDVNCGDVWRILPAILWYGKSVVWKVT